MSLSQRALTTLSKLKMKYPKNSFRYNMYKKLLFVAMYSGFPNLRYLHDVIKQNLAKERLYD